MRPIVNGLEQKYKDQVNFVRLDYDSPKDREVAQKYHALYHPAFVVLDGKGEVSKVIFGAVPEETLEAAIRAVLE